MLFGAVTELVLVNGSPWVWLYAETGELGTCSGEGTIGAVGLTNIDFEPSTKRPPKGGFCTWAGDVGAVCGTEERSEVLEEDELEDAGPLGVNGEEGLPAGAD
jgi:hypothetical protein